MSSVTDWPSNSLVELELSEKKIELIEEFEFRKF